MVISAGAMLYEGKDIYSLWAFRIVDPPWLPANQSPTNILGAHTFGDFQLPLLLAVDSTPYEWSFFNLLLPLGQVFYSLLGLFSIPVATYIFLVLSVVVFQVVIYKIITSRTNDRLLISTILVFVSVPTLFCLDRGGAQLIAYASFCWGIYKVYLNNENLSAQNRKGSQTLLYSILIVFGISLKIYLLVPLALILMVTRFHNAKNLVLLLSLTNLVVSFFYGGPKIVLTGLFKAYVWQTGDSNVSWIFEGVSFSKLGITSFLKLTSMDSALKFALDYQNFVFVPGFVYILILILTFRILKLNISTKIALSLTTSFLVVPVSMGYTLTINSLVIAFLMAQDNSQSKTDSILRKSILFSAFFSMLPLPTSNYLYLISLVWFIHTCFLVSVIIPKGRLLWLSNRTSTLSSKTE